MPNEKFRFYEFGEFRLDARRRILTKNGQSVHLTARNFDLLLVMVENEGRILSHDELLDAVWEDTFVEQTSLKKGVSALRHILEESADTSFFIKTVPRRGYSFVAPVRAFAGEQPETLHLSETEVVVEEIIEVEDDAPAGHHKALPAGRGEPAGFAAQIKRFKIPLAAAILLLAAGAVLFAAWSFSSVRPTLSFSIENTRAKRLTSEGNLGNSAPISPDGNYIVYPIYFGDQAGLWLRQVQTGSVARLTPMMAAQYWAFEFSPDGNYVYYILHHLNEPGQSGLYRIPSLGGTPQKITDRASGGLTFAPDGSRLAFTRRTDDELANEVVSAKLDGSDLRRVFVISENKFLWSLKFSPDSYHLLCSIRERADNKVFGYVAEIPWDNASDKPSEKIVFPREENQVVINAAWVPDRTSLLVSLRQPNADICQLWQYYPSTGERRRVTNDDNSYRFINLTRDGKNLVTVQESYQSEAWTADAATLDFHQIPNANNFGRTIWTKDDRLIYEALEDGQETLWLNNADGTGKQRLTQGADGIYLYPSISQDGSFITFLSNRSGAGQIWRINLNGTNPQQLTSDVSVGWHSKLLADGQTLLFMKHNNAAGWNLYKQTADGKITQVTRLETDVWCVSPDEKFLAASLRDEKTGKYKIHLQNLESGETVKVLDINVWRQISFTRDGRALVYISTKQDGDELTLQPLDDTPAKILSSPRGMRINNFDWSFDGSKLVVIRGKNIADAFLIRAQEN